MTVSLLLKALVYFPVCFLAGNLWLMADLRSAAQSGDEVGKGRVLLKGIVAHFAFSLLIILVYYKFIFGGTRTEVFIAMAAYVISLVQYAAAATRMQ